MLPYQKLHYWKNQSNRQTLQRFKGLVANYFKDFHPNHGYTTDPIEGKEAKQLRPEINKTLKEAQMAILSTGYQTTVQSIPPPIHGGTILRIDLLNDIFNISDYEIGSDAIIDLIDRAIGVYEKDRNKSIIRTFNPLYWIDKLFTWIARLPFALLEKFGLNKESIESGLAGKYIKTLLYFVQVLIAMGVLLETFGLLDNLKNLVRSILD